MGSLENDPVQLRSSSNTLGFSIRTSKDVKTLPLRFTKIEEESGDGAGLYQQLTLPFDKLR